VITPATRSAARTLLDTLREPAVSDRPAVLYLRPGAEPEIVSRPRFRQMAEQYARGLHARGVAPGDVVIVAHAEGLDALYSFWGALILGAVPSMFPVLTEKLDPDAYLAAMRLLVRHAGARIVVTTADFVPLLAGATGCPTVGFDDLSAASTATLAPVVPDPDAVAFLQHSSGTTGLQKGVALAHRAVLNQIVSYSDALALTSSDVVVSWLPLYHDMGLIAGFLLPLVQAIPLVLMSPFDWIRRPAMLLRALHEHGGTLSWLPNFAYSHCARRILDRDLDGIDLGRVRAFINCSEPVRDASQRLFLERFAAIGVRPGQLGASYAMAENTFAVTQTPIGRPPRLDVSGGATHVSCGPPIPGVEVRIEDARADGEVGEIQVRSDCMLTGYHGRPDLQAGLFADGWYRTGDLGYRRDGELYVVGRKKDVIIVAGKNLYPHDIEDAVHSVAGVHPGRAVAFGVPDAAEGTELVAVVAEVDAEDAADRKRIGAAIRGALVTHLGVVASYVHLVGPRWLLKTSSGKIARAANRDKWLAERAAVEEP
jgi:fatty-acyl-CoA synthase